MSPKKASYLMLAGAMFWGTNPALVKLSQWAPLSIAWSRALFCAGLFLLLLLYQRSFSFKSLGLQLCCGVFLAANSALFVAASWHTSPANAVLLMFCFPWVTMALDFCLLGKRPARFDLIRLVMGFIGVLVIVSGGLEGSGNLGNGLAVLAGVSIALHIFFGQKLEARHGGNREILNAIFFAWLLSLILLFPWAFSASNTSQVILSSVQWHYLVLLGLFSGIPWLLWSRAIAFIPGHVVGALLGVEVFVAALLGWWCLQDLPTYETWLGGLFIMVAAVWQVLGSSAKH